MSLIVSNFIANLIQMIKRLIFIILYLIVFKQAVFAEIWDFGLGILIEPGRMENYAPIPGQIEIGVSSVKGYGFAYSIQTTFEQFIGEDAEGARVDRKDLDAEESINEDIPSYTFELSSAALMLFYRFENYVDRWDFGLMFNQNQYTVKIENNSEAVEEEILISYTGPYIQYSNTIKGYETDDWFYGFRLFYLSLNNDSNSYNLIGSNDTYIRAYKNKINNFINENNPKTSAGIHMTFGRRN